MGTTGMGRWEGGSVGCLEMRLAGVCRARMGGSARANALCECKVLRFAEVGVGSSIGGGCSTAGQHGLDQMH